MSSEISENHSQRLHFEFQNDGTLHIRSPIYPVKLCLYLHRFGRYDHKWNCYVVKQQKARLVDLSELQAWAERIRKQIAAEARQRKIRSDIELILASVQNDSKAIEVELLKRFPFICIVEPPIPDGTSDGPSGLGIRCTRINVPTINRPESERSVMKALLYAWRQSTGQHSLTKMQAFCFKEGAAFTIFGLAIDHARIVANIQVP